MAPYDAEGLEWLAGMGEENVAEFGAAATSTEALDGFLAESCRAAVSRGYDGWRDDDLAFLADWGVDLRSIRVPGEGHLSLLNNIDTIVAQLATA